MTLSRAETVTAFLNPLVDADLPGFVQPLVEDPATTSNRDFQQLLQHESRLSVWGTMTLSATLMSPCAHYTTLLFGLFAVVFYTVSAVIPPFWVSPVREALHLPEGMQPILSAFFAAVTLAIIIRAWAAQKLLLSGRIVLNDQRVIDQFDAARSRPHQSFKFLLIACGVICVGVLFSPHVIAMALLHLAPFLIAALPALGPADLVLQRLVDFSRFKAEVFCSKLDPSSQTADIATNETYGSSFWCDLTEQHIALDQELEDLWCLDHGGMLVLADLAIGLPWALLMVVCAVASKQQGCIVFFTAAALGAVIRLLMHLYPIAKVTSLCQSQGAKARSILRLAVQFVNHRELTQEARADQFRFLQYVRGTPTGIEVPLLGLVTEDKLLFCAKTVITIAPVALTHLLRTIGEADPK